MPALGRRRQRHRAPLAVAARPRRSVVVELPEAPGSPHRPPPLVLAVITSRPVWNLPADPAVTAGVAVLLAVLDLARPGAVLALVGDAPEHALLAAAYSTRLVRALAPDGLVAHAARQAAASNALPVIVEERRFGGRRDDAASASLDDYVRATGLEPAVVHLGPGVDPAVVLPRAVRTLAEHRPWVVVTAPAAEPAVPSTLIALSYRLVTDLGVTGASRVYVLAPEAAPAVLAHRAAAWADALSTTLSTTLSTAQDAAEARTPASVLVDLRDGGTEAPAVR